MKNLKNSLTRKALTIMSALSLTGPLFAQTGTSIDATTALGSVKQQLTNVVTPVIVIVQIVMGFVAVVFVAINLVKYFKSPNQETNNDLLKIGIGLIIGIILLQVIRVVFLQ